MNRHYTNVLYDYPQRQTCLFILFLLMYEISTYVANDMIMPGMLKVVHYFHADESFVSASLTAFILGGASLQIFLGPLSDRFGRRPVMIAGAAFFLICTIFISASFSMSAFMWGRFFQGMGLCFIIVIGYATLHELYDGLYAIRLVSIMNIITIIAPLTGPLLGVLVLHVFISWRAIFLIIAVFAAAALIGLYLYMPETVNKFKKDGSHVPYTSLNLKVVKNNYLALLKNKAFMFGAIALGMGGIPIIAWIGVSPLILMQKSHLSILSYALWQIPIFIAATSGNLVMRGLTHFISLSRLIRIGALLMLLSAMMIFLLSFLFKTSYIVIIIGISCFGFTWGLTSGPLTRLTLFSTAIPKGTAAALMNLILMIIVAMGNQLAGLVYIHHQNFYFGLLCTISGVLFILFYYLCFKNNSQLAEK